jgi:hypothetical protein
LVWFDHYRTFLIHHADLATQTNAQAIILGGEWLTPALPGGSLVDGSASGVPADSEARWRNLISEIRGRFSGKIYWALPLAEAAEPPVFLDSVDGIYLLWDADLVGDSQPLAEGEITPEQVAADQAAMEAEAGRILDSLLQPLQASLNKPLLIALEYPSAQGAASGCAMSITGDCLPISGITTSDPVIFSLSLDLQEQVNAFNAVLNQIASRNWISGVVSRGFYPPAELMDPAQSSHGKPIEDLLKLWIQQP